MRPLRALPLGRLSEPPCDAACAPATDLQAVSGAPVQSGQLMCWISKGMPNDRHEQARAEVYMA